MCGVAPLTELGERGETVGCQEWPLPPANLVLAHDEVHVWRAPLDLEASRVGSLRQMLTHDERARADAFSFPADRRSCIVARAVLRSVLAIYLDMDPRRVPLRRGPFGKPALDEGCDGHSLNFNISHSHELSVCAIALERQVGIDVERIRPVNTAMEIAERFFSPSEASALRALAGDVRNEAFFACWTRKEAYIKARGDGLSNPLNQFSVSVLPGHAPALLETTDARETSRWSVHTLSPAPGYLAALVVEATPRHIRRWSWS